MESNDSVLVATVGQDGVQAIGPSGRGVRLPAGQYSGIEFDGVSDSLLHLKNPDDPDNALVCVQRSDVTIKRLPGGER